MILHTLAQNYKGVSAHRELLVCTLKLSPRSDKVDLVLGSAEMRKYGSEFRDYIHCARHRVVRGMNGLAIATSLLFHLIKEQSNAVNVAYYVYNFVAIDKRSVYLNITKIRLIFS